MGKDVFIYLASKSERRIEFLRGMKIPFQTVRSAYRERLSPQSRPEALAVRHALGKALHARLPRRKPEGRPIELILGADTVVYFRKRPLGKPAGYRAAEEMILAMTGRVHEVYTGIALIHPGTGLQMTGFEKTRVYFKRWDRKKIRKYVRAVRALDKAGAYAIQSRPSIVSSYRGSFSNVVGLPKELLRKMIREMMRAVKNVKTRE